MIEYYLLPKLISFAERAWSPAPAWENLAGTEERIAGITADWSRFSSKIAACEFPKLDFLDGGYDYRVPPPGAVIDKGSSCKYSYSGLQSDTPPMDRNRMFHRRFTRARSGSINQCALKPLLLPENRAEAFW
jgi:hypothetical protein